jgi:cyanophycinase
MIPKGTVLIIGGAEDKGEEATQTEKENKQTERFEILKELISGSSGKKRIEIITTASDVTDEIKQMYKKAFKKLHFNDIGFIDIKNKQEAKDITYCERVEKAHAVFFSGGDQFTLSAILGGTDVVRIIKDKYTRQKDFVVAGTSAGAMAMSKVMIMEGGTQEAILKDDLKIATGLGIFDTCIIDTHFIKRGRFGRLAHAVIMNPESLGIGLGEDTALIIKNGNDAVCSGSGMVVIIDGNQIEETNITEVEDGTPVFAGNLKVHILTKESKFSIKERKLYPIKKKRKAEAMA